MKKSNFSKKQWLRIIMVIVLIIVVDVAVMTVRYPRKMKQMFVQSSIDAMEAKLEDASFYINDNIEMNYEEIRLLAGLIEGKMNGSEYYDPEVLRTLRETMKSAGFTNIGILRENTGHLFATMSDGKKVQLNTWVISMDYDAKDVSVELQTSPFSSADYGEDALVFRYKFQGADGKSYMLIAEKPQEVLSDILSMKSITDGLKMMIRKNGNVVYSEGMIGSNDAQSYNIYAMMEKLGADQDKLQEVKTLFEEKDTGIFTQEIEGETYYYMFRKIKNTNWICLNAYSETVMAGEHLAMVNKETLKLVTVVAALLILALIFSIIFVINNMKKESEKKILETEKLFEEMSRYIPLAFAILRENDSEPKFTSYNFYEVIHEESFDFSMSGIVSWMETEMKEEDRDLVKREGKYEHIIFKNGRYFQVGFYSIGMVNQDNHFVCIINDITDDMEAKKLLEDSINRSNAASKSKTQFLSKMSHEIRTPLNSVIGFSRLALDGWDKLDNEELRDYITKIQISGNYLLELVSDILDISRIEEGRMQISKSPCSLDAMVNEIVDAFQGQMKRKGHQFIVDKNYDDIVLDMDSFHTKQILNNLISNACKYTEENGVVGFEITTKKVDEKKMAVQFVVQDTGIGMSPEFQAKIFEPFTQDDKGMQMKKQVRGSGLGMSICKNLVDMQNGTIKLESVPGEGSAFTVVLTFDIADKSQVAENSKKAQNIDYSCLKGKKILVVDDVEMNRIFIEKVLENMGMVYDEAENGQQAVDMFAASKPGEYFGIFMDVNMPVMNGHVATETIRKMQREDAKTIMIAGMTADAFSDDVNKALMSGMNCHISKPVQIERVAGVLMETYEKEAGTNEK